MKPILFLEDKDIFPEGYTHEAEWEKMTERVAVRAIVIDSVGKIALCGTKYWLLPGGGVEIGESLEDACIRECLEEIGCSVNVERNIGYAEETRNSGKRRHQLSHCFVARVIGEKGLPQSTEDNEKGMKVSWHTPDEALEILKEQIKSISFKSYNSCFNVRIHYAFLKKFLEK